MWGLRRRPVHLAEYSRENYNTSHDLFLSGYSFRQRSDLSNCVPSIPAEGRGIQESELIGRST